MNRIYEKLRERKMIFRHVCEVGVYVPETSNVLEFINDGIHATLVEADPETVQKIRHAFARKDVKVFPVAVWDKAGTLQFSKAASSTFATELPSSPALENDGYDIRTGATFEVACLPFSDIDDGTIDLLSIDIEGAEWYVLKHLQSRPKVLSIETHGKYYTNPYLPQIMQWLQDQRYELWYKDGSDSVYIQQGLFDVSFLDRLEVKKAEWMVRWKKFKRNFRKS